MREAVLFEGRPPEPNLRDKFEALPPVHATACALGKVMSPNGWTLIRLPIAAATIYANHKYGPEVAASMYAGNAVLDYVDGFVARAIKKITKKGELGDPFADKIVNNSHLIDLATQCHDPVFLTGIGASTGTDVANQLARGSTLAQLKFFLNQEPEDPNYKGSPHVGANWPGKNKTMIQGGVITAMLYNSSDPTLATVSGIALGVAAASGLYGRQLRKEAVILPKLKDLPRIPLKGNTEVLFTPESFREELLTSIKNAKERIYISALYITPDEAGQEIVDALVEAKKANPHLDIKVLVDFHRNQRGRIGDPKNSPTGLSLFKTANDNLPEGQKIDFLGVPVANKESKGVFHTKGIVIDTTLLYSGASLNNVYLHKQDNYRLDRYWVFREEKALSDTVVSYLKSIAEHDAVKRLDQGPVQITPELKKAIKDLRRKFKNFQGISIDEAANDNEMQAILLAGVEQGNIVSETITNMIHAAEKEVTLYTPYFNITKNTRSAIKQALEKGVHIDLIVGDKKANDFYRAPETVNDKSLSLKEKGQLAIADTLPYIYEQNLKAFVEEFHDAITAGLLNVHIWEDRKNTFHVKGADIDGGEAILETGHNMNGRSDNKDTENGILILHSTQKVRQELQEEKAHILEHTRPIHSPEDIPSIQSYPPAIRKRLRVIRTAKKAF